MILKKWEDLPIDLKNSRVRIYHESLEIKKIDLFLKRIFDLTFSLFLLVLLSPIFILLFILIKMDSKGPVIFLQTRVTQYGKPFRIMKFRTMVVDAEKLGSQITGYHDKRITKVGKILRKYRLDEFPQLINILVGDMSFVGTRPEVVKYVDCYSEEMKATLLLPAGVTSEASILFKDEEKILKESNNIDETYINSVLPEKMKINLEYIKNFSFIYDLKIILATIKIY
jgi:lipopolysaccharide/colanic/teichoic acid biosynthesis glycosyltransferase